MSAALKDFLISLCIFVVIGLALVWIVTGTAEAKPKKAAKTITLTQAEAEQCNAGGGCILITKQESAAIIELMESLEKAAKQASCKSI